MSVKQSIKVTNAGLSPILSVAQGTGAIEYEFTVSDFDIPSGSAAVAYNIQPTGNIVSQTCSISGNTITVKPPAYYFLRGKNYMQFQVSRSNEDLFSFLIEVWCAPNISQPEVIVAENPSLVSQLISDVGLLSSQLDNLLSIPSGSLSTSADAALADIKVGWDGTTYDTPGDAVRGQIGSLSEEIVELNDIVGQMIFNGIRSQASIDTDVYVKAGTTYKITYHGNTAVNCFVKDNIEPYVTLTPNDIKTFTPQASGYLVLYKTTLIDGSAFSLNVETENSFNRRIKAADAALADIKVGWDGTTYDTPGDAVRGQIGSLSEEIVELNDIVGQMIFNGIRSQASIDTDVYVKAGTTYKITYHGNTAVNCFVKDNIEPYVTLTPNDIKTFTPQASGYLVLYKTTLIDGSAFSLNVETENSLNRRIKALEGQEYHVGTGQEYTSFIDCLKALKAIMGKKTIYVHSGTYDIFNEIGGSDYTLSITEDNGDWESVSVIVPPNTHIIGLGDVVFNFMPTPEQMTKASAHLISPLNVQGSCIIENITINADNCRYGIHDETSGNSYFTGAVKRYKNVVVNKYWSDKTLGNPIPYGCGFDDDMEFSFDNCVFNQKRNTESGQSMAFHNRGNKSNTRININNCVLTGTGKSIKFGSLTNSSSVHDKVFIANTFLENNIVIKNEGDTIEKTNPFDITMVGCSDIEFEITVTNNPYIPKVYSI